ncbi:kinase-like domain-containing protein [Hyaloraphidium curvatum]|nr:kinase-like domain-containing protein [Hyaloraphidium curvatum]
MCAPPRSSPGDARAAGVPARDRRALLARPHPYPLPATQCATVPAPLASLPVQPAAPAWVPPPAAPARVGSLPRPPRAISGPLRPLTPDALAALRPVPASSPPSLPALAPDPFAHGRLRRAAYRPLRIVGLGAGAAVQSAVCLETYRSVALKVAAKPLRIPGEYPPRRAQSAQWGSTEDARADPGFRRASSFDAQECGRDPADVRRRFEAADALRHPNLVEVHEVFETEDAVYLVEELAAADLQTYLNAQGPLPLPDLRDALRSVLSALAHLHAHGLAHRALKPSNVLLRAAGDLRTACLADFSGDPMSTSLTGTVAHRQPAAQRGGPRATPSFLAPELLPLAHPSEHATPESDLWAAGALGVLMLTGRPPLPEGLPGGTDPALAELLAGLMHPDPLRRPPAALALRHPFFLGPAARGEGWLQVRPKLERKLSGADVVYDGRTGELRCVAAGGGLGGTV